MTDLSDDDIAALRKEGDFGAYLRLRFGAGETPAAATPAPPVIGSANGPLHKPGAWPSGTRTDRPTCHPDCDCATHPVPAP
jgi:hypothetical protein